MAVQVNGPAPYAPAKTLLSVISRHRNVGFSTISLDVLTRMGVPESLAPRTMQSLRLLDLADDKGNPTDEFEALRKAPTPELPARMASLLRDAYAPVFEVVDPTAATVEQLGDAFRHFTPPGQRGRMVTLFMGLMESAGMIEEAPKQRPGPKPVLKKTVPRKIAPKPPGNAADAAKNDPVVDPPPADGWAEVVTVDLGAAGQVVVNVGVKWLQLDDTTFVALRKAISDMKALATATEAPAVTAGSDKDPAEEDKK